MLFFITGTVSCYLCNILKSRNKINHCIVLKNLVWSIFEREKELHRHRDSDIIYFLEASASLSLQCARTGDENDR